MKAVWGLSVVCAVGALLAGCSTPTAPSTPPTPQPNLSELREQYGLVECPHTDPEAQPVEGGLPQTALTCLGTDQPVNLAGLPKEPMVINLWAQWCEPCRAESKYLAEVSAATDVAFLGINYQDPQPDWAIEFASLVKWRYPHIQDMDRELRAPLQIQGLPTTLFVRDGIVVGRHTGEIESAEQLRALMQEHLGTS